ncbi:MAG: nickel pincer cofactor biosynthesis protein LarC [Gammaproteobacteria bacterium]|nr:nickel pincer cofactor biosynthesis protein LarC [Gammaproteobacteria bacterium]
MSSIHIHIDPVGGIAGDMFVSAMLDLYPEHKEGMLENLHCISALHEIEVEITPHEDSVLTGKRFSVSGPELAHHHAHYPSLLNEITDSSMTQQTKDTASRILLYLAEAEAAVHGVELDQVILHEVGSPDSLTDIVCAAYLINAVDVSTWSCASLPVGNGRVNSAHGELPLPAPAVVELLKGYPVHNDGRDGERVTPTGAAILRSLSPQFSTKQSPMNLIGSGHGFGSATFQGMSNVLRLTAFEAENKSTQYEKIAVLEFEVDDQSPEDLSIGLDQVRDFKGVVDVIQFPAIGKKNRLTVHVQVLASPEQAEEVATKCLLETSTLGVRVSCIDRITLWRAEVIQKSGDAVVPLKVAERPDGQHTAKVEAEHLSTIEGYRKRKRLKQTVEQQVENDPPQI